MFLRKSLSLKIFSREKHSQIHFCCLCANLCTVKIWGQSDKFPMSFSSLQCLLQVQKWDRESSAKYVNQTGNFYFQPKLKIAISLPVFNLFQWFLFNIRNFIRIIWRKLAIWRYTVTLRRQNQWTGPVFTRQVEWIHLWKRDNFIKSPQKSSKLWDD